MRARAIMVILLTNTSLQDDKV